MQKTFVLDTSALLHDPQSVLEAFQDNHLVIPGTVIYELDKLKHHAVKGWGARLITRKLEAFRNGDSLSKGVPTSGGGTLRTDFGPVNFRDLPTGYGESPDHVILLVAKRLHDSMNGEGGPVTLVSKDLNMRLKADGLGLRAEDYECDKTGAVSDLYDGLVTLPVHQSVLSEINRNHKLDIPEDELVSKIIETMPPNACCVLVAGREGAENKRALALYKKSAGMLRHVATPSQRKSRLSKISPCDDRQCFAFDLMMDDEITLVTIAGKAGTGKTLIALLAGLELQLQGKVDQVVVMRPTVERGEPMGFLPGTLEEKFAPWVEPIEDCVGLILEGRDETFESLVHDSVIDLRPFNYVKGKTFRKTFLIVDETQNIGPEDAKAIATRAGPHTKVVFTGDLFQVDNVLLDEESNGLSHLIKRCPGAHHYGHIMLDKSERSELADWAADNL